jgi:ribonuclease HI
VGFGGVFRDDEGKILRLFSGFIGINSNNAAEIWALLQGLKIAHLHWFFKFIVEGDSQLTIHILTRLQHGSPPSKISDNCRLESLLELVQPAIRNIVGLIPSHVRREEERTTSWLSV